MHDQCLRSQTRRGEGPLETSYRELTIQDHAMKIFGFRLYQSMNTLCVGIVTNEMQPNRQLLVSVEGLNKGRPSSTFAYCESRKSKFEKRLCHMAAAATMESILAMIGENEDRSLSPVADLHLVINDLIEHEPLLYKYQGALDPATHKEWAPEALANDVCYLVYGTLHRTADDILFNVELDQESRKQEVTKLKEEANQAERSILAELAKADSEINEEVVKEKISESLRRSSIATCSQYEQLQQDYSELKREASNSHTMQQCFICEATVAISRVYSREGIDPFPADHDAQGEMRLPPQSRVAVDVEPIEVSRPAGGSEQIEFCDLPYFLGDGSNSLVDAFKKCGGDPFSDSPTTSPQVNHDNSAESSSFVEVSENLEGPLDVALALAMAKAQMTGSASDGNNAAPGSSGGFTAGLSPKQKEMIQLVQQMSLKQQRMPTICNGDQLLPGDLTKKEQIMDCVEATLRQQPIFAKMSQEQCKAARQETKIRMQSQASILLDVLGSSDTVGNTISELVHQIEISKLRTFTPGGLVREGIPNPTALREFLLQPQQHVSHGRDLCVDIQMCSDDQAQEQIEFIKNVILQNKMFPQRPLDTLVEIEPPGFHSTLKAGTSNKPADIVESNSKAPNNIDVSSFDPSSSSIVKRHDPSSSSSRDSKVNHRDPSSTSSSSSTISADSLDPSSTSSMRSPRDANAMHRALRGDPDADPAMIRAAGIKRPQGPDASVRRNFLNVLKDLKKKLPRPSEST